VERVEKFGFVTYLDVHVVIWLYEGNVARLSRVAANHVQNDSLFISPAVLLELELLHEIRRLTRSGEAIVGSLSKEIGLSVCQLPFASVVQDALRQKWTRDPFDRLIVAQASANDAPLITKDRTILSNYKHAIW
jgi:PIN domain nuclease of toxin-antitoxin system